MHWPLSASVSGRFNLSSRIRTFAHDESGVMIELVLVWMVLMMVVAGLSIDFSRAEYNRVRVQGTLDRAVLAASDLDQVNNPRDVVIDYFNKAGLLQFLDQGSILVTGDGITTRAVTARATGVIKSSLLQFAGIDTISTPALARAEESVNNIEINLVLDVSGSMNSNSRLANLKVAARCFTETIIGVPDAAGGGGRDCGEARGTPLAVGSNVSDNIGISIVLYNSGVNASSISSALPIEMPGAAGDCVLFTDYTTTEVDLNSSVTENLDGDGNPDGTYTVAYGNTLKRGMVFDWNSTGKSYSKNQLPVPCWTLANNSIQPITGDAAVLNNKITGLTAGGYTSIEIGMRWGTMLLDPSFQPVNLQLAQSGIIPMEFKDLPASYDLERSAKILVLMSDGENTRSAEILDPYRTGLSPIYRNSSDQLTIQFPERSSPNYYRKYSGSGGTWSTSPYNGSTQLEWNEVWNRYSVRWVVDNLYDAPLNLSNSQENALLDSIFFSVESSLKNSRTTQICDAARTRNSLRVYTIAFEAPWVGRETLRNCATTPEFYQNVNGIDINDAFKAIARDIAELRLTL